MPPRGGPVPFYGAGSQARMQRLTWEEQTLRASMDASFGDRRPCDAAQISRARGKVNAMSFRFWTSTLAFRASQVMHYPVLIR